jgi:predicted enzyme related to lactoylglutathione lyase
MPVTGIGGFFFRCDDPDALAAWYRTHLGVGGFDWRQAEGPTVLAPFKRSSDYFAADKPFMLNLRVSDLDALLHDLAAADISVVTNPEWDSPEMGRFARIHDPEGNPIELWEPAPE